MRSIRRDFAFQIPIFRMSTKRKSEIAALQGSAEDAGEALDALDALWQRPQGYLHIVISHTELDEAEALLAQARAAVRQGDMSSLYPVMAELRSQFKLLAETQQVSLKNIL